MSLFVICVFFFLKVGSDWAMDLDRARRFRRSRFGVKKNMFIKRVEFEH